MTSGPMPSPPMTAMREAAIAKTPGAGYRLGGGTPWARRGPPSGAPTPGGPTGFTDPRNPQAVGGPVPVPIPAGSAGPIPVPPPGANGAVTPVSGTRGGALDQAYAAAAERNPLFSKLQYNSQTH